MFAIVSARLYLTAIISVDVVSVVYYRIRKGRRYGSLDFRNPALRVSKPNGAKFRDDPIYQTIERSLERPAVKLRPEGSKLRFFNPFLSNVADTAKLKSIALCHPLGGCRMADNVDEGVVDEFGRVFDKSKASERGFHDGLYIADASIIPTSLASIRRLLFRLWRFASQITLSKIMPASS